VRRYRVGGEGRTQLPKPDAKKLAAWLRDLGPERVQSDSSKEAAKAEALAKRERRAAKWRERGLA